MPDIKNIGLHIVHPEGLLKQYVHSIWLALNPENSTPLSFKVLNDGSMGVSFNFGDNITCELEDEQLEVQHGAVADGPSKSLFKVTFHGNIRTLGIRFHAYANALFSPEPIENLSGKIIPVTNATLPCFAKIYPSLTNTLAGSESSVDGVTLLKNAMGIIESELINHVHGLPKSQRNEQHLSVLDQVIQCMEETPEQNISDMLNQFNLNARQLQRLFRKYVGLSPKSFLRLRRVKKTKEELSALKKASLTDVSQDLGYFDQAHFIREFSELMELTPGEYQQLKQSPSS